MKTMLLVAGLLLATPAMADKVIAYDPGGDVGQYIAKAERLARSGQKVRLKGFCASACNVYLWKQWNLNLCTEPGTKLRFHMPFMFQGSLGNQRVSKGKDFVKMAHEDWAYFFLGRFDRRLNSILARATRTGKIPIPARGDPVMKSFNVAAELVLPLC